MFVQVTVDPNDETFPFIAEDHIDIIYNNTREKIYTAAWGQNAYFHGGPDAFTTLSCHEVWNNDKPHVVYGVLEIEPNCDLTINSGCQVYLHKGAGILVNEGRLFVQGQKGSEVVFQGDRLEAEYQDVPGQWGIELDFQIGGSQGPDIYTISRGVTETTIVTNSVFTDRLLHLLKQEKLKSHTKNLASITVKLPSVNTEIYGVYYYILKHLAWEGLNIVEIVSTANEFTVIFNQDDVDKAFKVLMQLKRGM
jgi:hypothetical protein